MRTFYLKPWHYVFMASWVTVIIAAAYLAYNHDALTQGEASLSWPSTQGVVATSRISRSSIRSVTPHASDLGGARHAIEGGTPNRTGGEVFYFEYRYTVDGQEHTSRRVSYRLRDASIRTKAAKYPEGREVTVFYDPDDPGTAVLEPGSSTRSTAIFFGLLGYIAIMTLLPAAFVAVSIRHRKRRERESNAVTAALRGLGSQFRPYSRHFGDPRALTDDPHALADSRLGVDEEQEFHLLEPPHGGYHRGNYSLSSPPMGIAVMAWEGRLVEIHNDGQIEHRGQNLLEVTLETAWCNMGWDSPDRDPENRPISAWRNEPEKASELRLIYLRRCGAPWHQEKADRACRDLESWDRAIPEERRRISPFDTGVEAFDGRLAIRRAGVRVAGILCGSTEVVDIFAPLDRWDAMVHDLHVHDLMDVWLHIDRLPPWRDVKTWLPDLLSDLSACCSNLERILARDPVWDSVPPNASRS